MLPHAVFVASLVSEQPYNFITVNFLNMNFANLKQNIIVDLNVPLNSMGVINATVQV